MIEELASIVLTTDIPEWGLKAGDIGTVVRVHQQGQGYTVEFVTLSGNTVAVVTVLATQVRPIQTNEIAHVREFAVPAQSAATINPWVETAGMFRDDPTLEAMLKAIYAERDAE
jgi:hypothetical protein